VWDAIFAAGAAFGIKPIGLGARDTLRLEMGFCLYGNDITDTSSPLEAGLSWITKFTKDFTARPILEAQKAAGISRKLVGFKMLERAIPRGHYPITDGQGNVIGEVTSGTQSPTLGYGIGMGYVQLAHAKVGSTIAIEIRGKQVTAEVVKIPFVTKAN
jgi:aminomethyltransferase